MQKPWYSPAYVISMAEDLVKDYGQDNMDKDTLFQRVGEMKGAAIMLLALHKAFGKHFLMQSSQEESPDVFTLYQEEVPGKNIDTKYQTVEVVIYETHSKMPVADFVLKSKLINPKKAYDEDTIILCYIRKGGTFIDFNILYEELKKHKFKPSNVFVLGNKISNERMFILSQVWPIIHHEIVDYVARANSYPLPYKMFFKRGVTSKLDYKVGTTVLKTNPFEVFDIDEEKVKEKYKR